MFLRQTVQLGMPTKPHQHIPKISPSSGCCDSEAHWYGSWLAKLEHGAVLVILMTRVKLECCAAHVPFVCSIFVSNLFLPIRFLISVLAVPN